MYLRGFYFFLIFLVIALPTWALWVRQQFLFFRDNEGLLNDNVESATIRVVPFLCAFVLLFAVFGFAYPLLGIWWNMVLSAVVSCCLMCILWQLLLFVKRKQRMHEIFDGWLAGDDELGEIWLTCNGIARKLLLKDGYLVFSLGHDPLEKLKGVLLRDLEQFYRKISLIEEEHFARVGHTPSTLEEMVRACKGFPRTEFLSLRSGPDNIRIKF
ncbi:MAG TPA: hypothetical protein VJ579_05305 [Candidatus Paceibacterota bacterium]|nr:hypothetical protein [Candidatus Paceibacterota bacterium]